MVLLPEQGRLEETSFPTLLLALLRARFDGSAQLERERVEKRFRFREGVPVFAESTLASESLSAQLVNAGVIPRTDAARISRQMASANCSEGMALLELRLLEPKRLFLALKQQLRARLIECFGWTNGTFTIEPGNPPSEAAEPFRIDLYPLIQEGIEAHWSSDRILRDLAPHMHHLAKRGALVAKIRGRLRSDAALAAFLDALDGSRTLWNVLKLASTPSALAAAWLLDAIQALEYAPAAEPKRSADGALASAFEIVFTDDDSERADRGAARRSAPAAPSSPQGESPAGAALRRAIAEKFARLDELDHYALLDVSANANAAAIKQAYLKAAKYYHPDALSSLHIEREVRDQANRVFARIGKAYAELSSPERRRRYDAALRGDEPEIDAEQIATAETLFRKGEILLKLGNFKGALEFLEPAVEMLPEEADYQNALGWALYKKHPSEPERAKQHLEHAAALAPNDGTVLFRLGFVLRALGESDAAADLLARARGSQPGTR